MLNESIIKDFLRRLCYCVVAFLFVGVLGRVMISLRHPASHLFFPSDRERFIEVDRGDVLGTRSVVAADRVTGVLYLVTDHGVCPLYQEDGSLMIYDEG